MSLQDALQAVLPDLRAQAESRMTSRCTIRRPSEPGERDDAGFRDDQGAIVYSGPCRVAGASRGGTGTRRLDVGGSQTELALRVLNLPAGTTGLTDSDVATVDLGDCAGLRLRLAEVSWQDQATALRISCVEDS